MEAVSEADERVGPGPRPFSGLRALLWALDFAAAVLGWTVATVLVAQPGAIESPVRHTATKLLLATATVVIADARRLYRARVCSLRAVEIQRLGQVVLILYGSVLLLGPKMGLDVPVRQVFVAGAITFLAASVFRGCYRRWLTEGRRRGRFQRDVVIVGSNEEAFDLHRLAVDHPELGLNVIGVVGDEVDAGRLRFGVPLLGCLPFTEELVRQSGAGGVLIAATALSTAELNRVSRNLLQAGIHVQLSSGLRGFAAHRLRMQSLAHEPVLYLEPEHRARWQTAVKRALDLVLGAIALLLSLPVLAVAALAIKLDSRGPIIFRQTRVGRAGTRFTIFKLRTMACDAEARYNELAVTQASRTGPLMKLRDDPRVTRVGRFLRATSIDELPQLLNVLRGSMSLVGPRPNLLGEAEGLDPSFLAHKGTMLPGITGLWQVEARDHPSFEVYRRLDLFYVENWSISLDIAILIATAQCVSARALGVALGRRRPEVATLPVRQPAAISP